jgi:hypothetical protein
MVVSLGGVEVFGGGTYALLVDLGGTAEYPGKAAASEAEATSARTFLKSILS